MKILLHLWAWKKKEKHAHFGLQLKCFLVGESKMMQKIRAEAKIFLWMPCDC